MGEANANVASRSRRRRRLIRTGFSVCALPLVLAAAFPATGHAAPGVRPLTEACAVLHAIPGAAALPHPDVYPFNSC